MSLGTFLNTLFETFCERCSDGKARATKMFASVLPWTASDLCFYGFTQLVAAFKGTDFDQRLG